MFVFHQIPLCAAELKSRRVSERLQSGYKLACRGERVLMCMCVLWCPAGQLRGVCFPEGATGGMELSDSVTDGGGGGGGGERQRERKRREVGVRGKEGG